MILVSAEEMQNMDRRTIEEFGLPGRVLMENAGLGATHELLENFGKQLKKPVAVVAGRGNNGGDGFVIARYLACRGIDVTVYLLSKKEKVKGDARVNLDLLSDLGVPVTEITDPEKLKEHSSAMKHSGLWVDAILGTGLGSDVRGLFADVIGLINSSGKPVFSVDIPSGLNANTGQPRGIAVKAHMTATFAFAKTGHYVYPGMDYTGKLSVIEIGIPPHITETTGFSARLITEDMVSKWFSQRDTNAHKGSSGHLLTVGGSPGKTGAITLAAHAALKSGAGLVTAGLPESSATHATVTVPEVMSVPLPQTKAGTLYGAAMTQLSRIWKDKGCMALGPGLSQNTGTENLVRQILEECPIPLVLDADALNAVSTDTGMLKNLTCPAVLTPHPKEMARLCGITVQEVQKDRLNVARDFARRFGVTLVLKGAGTIVALPGGEAYINQTGNSGMATAGMGDALTGIIAGLMVQGMHPEEAAVAGVYIHGRAGDLTRETAGERGFLTTELILRIPGVTRELLARGF